MSRANASPGSDQELDAALSLIIDRLRLPAPTPLAGRDMEPVDIARTLYRERRLRERHLGALVPLGEPGWDILLDLYIAHAERRPLSVTSCCIGACAPPTTALRWIARLVEAGAIRREQDPSDQRRSHIGLSDAAKAALDAYLRALAPP